MHVITSTIDPMSLKDLHGRTPYLHRDCGGQECLEVYFENEANRMAFRTMPMEPSSLDLSYSGDDWVDEG